LTAQPMCDGMVELSKITKKNPRGQTWGERLTLHTTCGVHVSTIEQVMALSSGLTRALADDMQRYTLPIPEFRLGTALAIQAAVYQSAYVWPQDESPNLYICLAGHSSVSKSSFLSVARRHLKALDAIGMAEKQSIIAPRPSHENAFQEALVARHTRIYLDDEWGLQVEDAYIHRSDPARAYVRRFLGVYEGGFLEAMNARTEGKSLKAVERPVVSHLCATTNETLTDLFAARKFISDGCASRYLFMMSDVRLKVPRVGKPNWSPSPAIVATLEKIHRQAYVAFDEASAMACFAGPSRVNFAGCSGPSATLDAWYDELDAEQETLEDGVEVLLASIRSRLASRVRKLATIHAIGCGRLAEDESDFAFAVAFGRWQWQTVKRLIGVRAGDFDVICQAVLHWFATETLAGEAYSASKIFDHSGKYALRSAKAKLGLQGPEQVLTWLVRNGHLVEVDAAPPQGRGGNRRGHVKYALNHGAREGQTKSDANANTLQILESMRQNVNSELPPKRARPGFLERPLRTGGSHV